MSASDDSPRSHGARPLSPYAAHLGFEMIEWGDGHAVVECLLQPFHANMRGIAHGGVLSSLMDMACGAATYSPSTGVRAMVTVSLTINYMKPVQIGDRVRAIGRRRTAGQRIVMCDVDVNNQAEITVATGLATFCVIGPP